MTEATSPPAPFTFVIRENKLCIATSDSNWKVVSELPNLNSARLVFIPSSQGHSCLVIGGSENLEAAQPLARVTQVTLNSDSEEPIVTKRTSLVVPRINIGLCFY